LKKHSSTLLVLLSLAIAITVGCGDSNLVPKFTKVAFISSRTVTPPTSLFVSNLDGTNVSPVPLPSTNVQTPSISADFKLVAYSFAGNVWVENSDGTNAKQLTTSNRAYFARISPNGKKVIYDDYTSNNGHIWVINSDGTGSVDLTATFPAGMTNCFSGSFSSDSSQVVYSCGGNSGYGIFTAKTDGTGTKTVITESGYIVYPFFTPDSKKVVYYGNGQATAAHGIHTSQAGKSSSYGVASVNIDGTSPSLLVPNAQEVMILNSTLYYSAWNSTNSLYQIYKANLDGTNATSISDGTTNDFLYSNGF
jgi:Tol biopolymer transport system component